MNGKMSLPTEMAVRIKKPKVFFFCLWRLAQRQMSKHLTFSELMEVLDSDTWIVSDFFRFKKIPVVWMDILLESEDGESIINHFKNGSHVEHPLAKKRATRVCDRKIFPITIHNDSLPLDVDSLNELDIINDLLSTEKIILDTASQDGMEEAFFILEKAAAAQKPEDIEQETSEEEKDMQFIPFPMPQEVIESRKNELLEKTLVVSQKNRGSFLVAFKRLAGISMENLENKLGRDLLAFFEKDGRIHKKWKVWALSFGGGAQFLEKWSTEHFVDAPDNSPTIFEEDPVKQTVDPPITIAQENRENFLIGFQGVTEWHDRRIFPSKAGPEKIKAFREDGIITNEWLKILAEKTGGDELIKRHLAIQKSQPPVTPTTQKKTRTVSEYEGFAKKEYASTILENMLLLSGLSKVALEDLLGWSRNTFYAAKAGKRRIYQEDMDLFAKKFGIPVENLYQKNVRIIAPEKKIVPEKQEETPPPNNPPLQKEVAPLCISSKIKSAINLAIFKAGGAAHASKEVFIGSLTVQLPDHVLLFYPEKNALSIMDRESGQEEIEIRIKKDFPFLM